MHARVLLSYMVLAFSLVSCAPVQWTMTLDKPVDLVWPPPPNPEKVRYLGEITSFVPTGKSLATILFGKDSDAGHILKPVAIAVADDGRIALADLQSKGVHLYIPAEQSYRLLDKVKGERLESPVSVAFGDDLRLYVADSALRKVFVFDRDGDYVGEISGSDDKLLERPTGITYLRERNALYVVDTLANEVDVFDPDGQFLYNFGQRGVGDGDFNMPTHIVAANDRIIVNDSMNFRAQVFSTTGIFMNKFGHHGDGSGDFAMPKGVAVNRFGVLYVAETLFDVIQVFNLQGDYLMSIGGKGTGPGQFWMPSGIFIDRYNKLYVCDTYNQRIQLFQLLGAGSRGEQ